MNDDALLAINCQDDKLYQYRHLIREMYQARFPRIGFVVNETCPLDDHFSNIVVRWTPPPYCPARECRCNDPHHGKHSADVHQKHPRLVDVADAAAEAGVEAVLFADTDCILSPRLDARSIARRCREFDAITPPIVHHRRGDRAWIWAHHEMGYPSLDRVGRGLDRDRLFDHWKSFGGQLKGDDPAPSVPMFAGFSDWLAFSTSFLRRVARDFLWLQQVWHEVAILTAILHNTGRIQVARCRVLWGRDRALPLADRMAMLVDNDFVHPIKFGKHDHEIAERYRDLVLAETPA